MRKTWRAPGAPERNVRPRFLSSGHDVVLFRQGLRVMSGRYTSTAIALHWLMAVLLPALFALGLYMHELELSPWKLKLYSWHKWAGVTAFLLVLLRLAWLARHRPPPLPASMSPRMRMAARIGHGALYLLMVAVPLSGWLMSSAKGVQTVYFGVLPIPDLLDKDKAMGELLEGAHAWLNYTFAALVAGHTAMALKHHFIDRNDVMVRMLPRFRRGSRSPGASP